MSLNRTRIATGCTIAALGLLAVVALNAGGDEPSASAPAAAPTPEVRTEIVRRTVHVKSKRRAPASAGSSAQAPGRTAAAPASTPASRVATPSRSGDDRSEDEHHGQNGDDEDRGHDEGEDDDGGRGSGDSSGHGHDGDD